MNLAHQPSAEAPPTGRRHPRRWRLGIAVAVATVLAGAGITAINMNSASAATVNTSAWYNIVNHNSGKVLDICGASTADGACVQQYTNSGGQNQQFQFVDAG